MAGESVDMLVRDAELLVTMTGEELRGGWVSIRDGFVDAVGPAGEEPDCDRRAERSRMPGHARADQYPSSHLPEPDAVVRPGGEQRLARVARGPGGDVGSAGRGGLVRVGVDRPGRTCPERLHHHV